MNELKELAQIDWWYVAIALVALLIVVKLVWSLFEWLFIEKLGIETKRMKQRRQESEKLKATAELAKTTAENLDKLQKKHIKDEEEFRKNLNDYMEESRKDRKVLHSEIEAQKELQGCQGAIVDKVDNISKKLDEMEEKENKRVQSEVKERIAQSYREYKKTKKITPEELEALEDLIETYEAHGGKNSFVHSLVQKEMYTWEIE